jgi:general secretion pathway protein A
MYLQSFGLREKPFTLSPDPRYLFLAESHREALAHLLYGVDQGEGFIAVVGEVGTGKTTLCRTLLQRLGAETEVAFLFNPDLSPLELLQVVCSELGVAVPAGASRRDLLDRINEFLVHNKREGRRVLLIIDEAQNLQPETLEQVRLLSNLETETSKLVQIVLLGQPELESKLASSELRQLRQRISVWWRLGPMKRAETFEYVRHRLRVAGGSGRAPFSDAALREVHRRSTGVPRVVNILCDRALLSAYGAGASQVRVSHVRRAAAELGPRRAGGALARVGRFVLHPGWIAAAGALAISLGAWQLLGGVEPRPVSPAALPAVSAPPPGLSPAPSALPVSLSAESPSTEIADASASFAALIDGLDAGAADASAARALLASWTLEADGAGGALASLPELVQALEARGLRVEHLTVADLDTLRVLGHPALLKLSGRDGRVRSVVLRHLDERTATLVGLGQATVVRVPAEELAARFTGEAWVPWRDFVSLPPVLRDGETGSSVYWLQATLAELGFYAGRPSGRFDDPTRGALRAFQASRGLEADGQVGPQTRMALYASLDGYALPRLGGPRPGAPIGQTADHTSDPAGGTPPRAGPEAG